MVNTSLTNRLNTDLVMKFSGESKENTASYRGQLLKSLQVGDILEGILINKTESGYVLELNSGVHIPVFLLDEIDLGKLLQFKVESNRQGEVHLSINNNKDTTQNFTQKVIDELGLSHTKEMEQCVKQFIAKELPLTKESLLSTHYLHRQYKIPSEVIINTLAKANQLTEKEIQALFAIKNQGIDNIVKDIKVSILQLEDVYEQFKVLENISKELPKEEKSIVFEKIVQSVLNREGFKDSIEGNLSPKQREKAWMDIIKHLESEGTWERDRPQKMDIENILRQNPNLYKEGFKMFIDELYDKAIGIDARKSKQPLQEQLEQFSQKVLRILDSSKIDAMSESGKDTITTLKQGVQVLQKLNVQGDYFIFPFINNTSLNKGEIYFFEPRKQLAKGEQSIYIVIALDLSMLNHLEIHINKIKNKLSLNIIVETEDIKKHLTKHIDRLWHEIQNLGYQLEKCTYTLQDQKGQQPMASYIEQKITAFDMKI